MNRVDDIYTDLELLIAEHRAYHKVIDENIRLKKAIDDIKTEICAYFTAKEKNQYLTFDVEQDIMDIINRHMKGGE